MLETRNIYKNSLRVIEKIPGLNLLQVAHFENLNVLMLSKVGTRSIRNALLAYHDLGPNPAAAWAEVSHVTHHRFATRYNAQTTKVILREPLDRLQSCWRQKISEKRDPGGFYFFQYYPLLRPDMAFIDFLKAISKIPTGLYEKHFMPLSFVLKNGGELRYDFIPLWRLDHMLLEIIGPKTSVSRANVTGLIETDPEARAYYDVHLKDRFALDETLFHRYGRVAF